MRYPTENPQEEISRLLSICSDPQASTAFLLCDRHDPAAIAFTLMSKDLSCADVSYGVLRAQSERLAAALVARGLRRGDRVATLMGKSLAYLVTVLAIWRVGAVHVPLFTAFATPAIAFRVTASRCKFIVCDRSQRPKLDFPEVGEKASSWTLISVGGENEGALAYEDLLESEAPAVPAAAVGGDGPIVLLYTSGTTGTPKGVIVPLRAIAAFLTYARYGLDIRENDVFWNAADPGWAYGLYYAVIAPLANGTRSVLMAGGFSAEVTFEVLRRLGVTNFAAAPTVFRALRASGIKPVGLKLRCASSAGEPLTPEVNEWSQESLGVAVHDHYGQTETGMLINNHHHPGLRRPLKPGSMGVVMPGWRAVVLKTDEDAPAAVGETGRLAIDLRESPLAWFEGYVDDAFRSTEKFSVDRCWYMTGDAGFTDEAGHFRFCSRDDDVIIMAGYRIGPFEIEAVLMSHPAVEECAVVAAPDPLRGEVLEAFVVVRGNPVELGALTQELQELVKRKYAAHAYPRRVHFIDALPKTPSGKVQRFVLRRRLRERSGDSHGQKAP
jgi:acetyl-CoA synthetase